MTKILQMHSTHILYKLAKILPTKLYSYATYLTDSVDDRMFLRPTNDEELLKEINQLKNKATLDVRVSMIKYV